MSTPTTQCQRLSAKPAPRTSLIELTFKQLVALALAEAVRLTLADADKPLTRVALRKILGVDNQRLGLALCDLENNYTAARGPNETAGL
jgi:hypothetical protein